MDKLFSIPQCIQTESELDEFLSTPTPEVIEAMAKLEGDLMILGVGGKMGPTLAKMAKKASDLAGVPRRIIGVSRFTNADVQMDLLQHDIETISCDLLNQDSLNRLPAIPNIIYMVVQKFGSTGNEGMTWALNTFLPGLVGIRFHDSRIVSFSTGNVYPFVTPASGGCRETDPVGPVGEYAQSCLGRERMFEYAAQQFGTRSVFIRLNYALELHYGVLVDIAQKVLHEVPIDLQTGYVNVIWQGDANAYVLCSFPLCQNPPDILNITGSEILSVRSLAETFGTKFGKSPIFTGTEQDTSLLNNAAKSFATFGYPKVGLEVMMDWIADWLQRDMPVWNKPTHFEERKGKF